MSGDKFREAWEKYNGRLHRYILKRMSGADGADDIRVEVWVRFGRTESNRLTEDQVLPWLIQVAKRLIVDHSRECQLFLRHMEAIGRHLPQIAPDSSADQTEEETQKILQVLQARDAAIQDSLVKLPRDLLNIFELHWKDGRSFVEIANMLEMREHTVRRRYAKAIDLIRETLENFPEWAIYF